MNDPLPEPRPVPSYVDVWRDTGHWLDPDTDPPTAAYPQGAPKPLPDPQDEIWQFSVHTPAPIDRPAPNRYPDHYGGGGSAAFEAFTYLIVAAFGVALGVCITVLWLYHR